MSLLPLRLRASRTDGPAAESDEPPFVAAGSEVVPGYVVIALLRRGNRLDVYDTWSTRRAARCVVKIVRPDRLTEAHTHRLLRREGQLLAELGHPHLVRAYEVVEVPQVAVVLETLTGPSLGTVLDERRVLIPNDVVLLGAQVASGLAYLHRHGCVHGDVTTNNIVLEGSMAKLLDLSLSGPPGPVRAGSGTRGYRSPEQAAGTHQSPATDVWGLGAVLHHALTGRTHDDTDPPSLSERVDAARRRFGLRATVMTVITACLEERAEDRMPMAQVAATLDGLAALQE